MSGLRRRISISALVVSLALAATACGGGGSTTSSGTGGLEKTDLTVGMLPLPEVAPVQIAIDKGFFKAEGLNVKVQTIQGGAAAMGELASGKLDVLHSNYVSALKASAENVAKLKVIAEAYVAKPNNFLLMAKKDSPVTSMADLKGKKIAVNTLNNVATLTVSAQLEVAGLKPEDVQFVEHPFPEMPGMLEQGQIDAAFLPEPFHELAASKNGAKTITDLMQGPTADFPIAGYLVTEEFASKNPKTVAAFQRGLTKAIELAISNSDEVDAALPKYTKIDQATADLMQLGGYSTSVNPTRLQRVADLMLKFGYLKAKFDVAPLVHSPAAS
ncbi:ABC transporter substrate-binding protein [Nonomuraea sp. NPDC050310]|uniref:ABC transporter substrate-binding protein n=1 Tax=unclassified Nonomuraea TaxID=2593643 RepID=UPI0033F82489